MKRKPILGETLFSLNVGNAARRSPQILTPVRVSLVGRKYFECEHPGCSGRFAVKHHLDTWNEVTDCLASSALYETKEEYAIERETTWLTVDIRAKFAAHGPLDLPLQTLRDIAALLSVGVRK